MESKWFGEVQSALEITRELIYQETIDFMQGRRDTVSPPTEELIANDTKVATQLLAKCISQFTELGLNPFSISTVLLAGACTVAKAAEFSTVRLEQLIAEARVAADQGVTAHTKGGSPIRIADLWSHEMADVPRDEQPWEWIEVAEGTFHAVRDGWLLVVWAYPPGVWLYESFAPNRRNLYPDGQADTFQEAKQRVEAVAHAQRYSKMPEEKPQSVVEILYILEDYDCVDSALLENLRRAIERERQGPFPKGSSNDLDYRRSREAAGAKAEEPLLAAVQRLAMSRDVNIVAIAHEVADYAAMGASESDIRVRLLRLLGGGLAGGGQ